ncbi:non-hemolytic phospholipase C precursor [Polychaeton citri CBS 116435]|uniref:Non-hemolytic phospholipase C n=1 Tax=Polychaeton citri CBS 116435 TaxID=1314669 RepID=A0A9P4QIK0_9PEZI|nr:non-hemolytic phospholipase C precursor [Polychaeton citri CBS 116435]
MNSFSLATLAVTAALQTCLVTAGSIADIEHVVLFMQENRAFDHYFGTMAGVRGFSDPNVQVTDGKPVFQQVVNASFSNDTDYLAPWYLNYLEGNWTEATQCMVAGDNGWASNHEALNHDQNNHWVLGNTPWSWGYFTRKEIPNHFAIAEGWTVGDMYQESVIASTNPNRVTWISGSINAPGSPQSPDEGGMTIDNNETPGCEGTNLNCYPLKWKTIAEKWQEAGASWQVYQDNDNFDDNPLAWFQQFQNAAEGSTLNSRGLAYLGLEKFYEDAAAGTLPQVSVIIGPAELSEHPPYQPKDGGWLQQKIVDVVTSSPLYNKTALIISYDETGGFGDHVTPYHSPAGTSGEWIEDPYNDLGQVYTGPGFRLPFYIISPWTRGGHVYVEHADHTSQIKFVEQWLESKGHNATTNQIPSWRRENMADLTKAFDFSHPDYSIPSMPNASYPSTSKDGEWNGYAVCESQYAQRRPPVPYGQQSTAIDLASEQGYKQVRGQLTEGRFLTLEMNGYALTNAHRRVLSTRATAGHEQKSQRWVLHQQASGAFSLSSAVDGKYLTSDRRLSSDEPNSKTHFTIHDLGDGEGYSLRATNGRYLTVSPYAGISTSPRPKGFQIFSVTYRK